jgi:hypothetical protein
MVCVILNNGSHPILEQRNSARRRAAHRTGHCIGIDFSDPPTEFVGGRARSPRIEARCITPTGALAPAFPTSQAILFDTVVDGAFVPV